MREMHTQQTLTYTNPVWSGYMADPFVLGTNGEYYAYGTGAVAADGRRFPVLHSRDLSVWEPVGGALEPLPELGTDAEYWAPAVAEKNGVYYLYYSAAPSQQVLRHRLRVATATHPAGPFRDVGHELLPDAGFTIDAHPFHDPHEDRWYLYYAMDYLDGERVGTGLAVVPIADDLVTVAGEPRTVLRAFADWQIFARNRTLYDMQWDAWHTLEGPCVVEKDGTYYCFFSGGAWETPGYSVSYAVASHPLGPWHVVTSTKEDGNDSLLCSVPERDIFGPGHNSVLTAPDGKTQFLVYHAWDTARTARRMYIDPLIWTPDGPRCDGPTQGSRTVSLR